MVKVGIERRNIASIRNGSDDGIVDRWELGSQNKVIEN